MGAVSYVITPPTQFVVEGTGRNEGRFQGSCSSFSSAYIPQASCSRLRLLMQPVVCALLLALLSAGSSSPANTPMMAMTTSNSMRVKPGGPNGRESRLVTNRRFCINAPTFQKLKVG